MSKLSETQTFVLNAAADHPQHRVETFPDNVKGGARTRVVELLRSRGWIAGEGEQCVITPEGLAAIGRVSERAAEPEAEPEAEPSAPQAGKPARRARENSKQAAMLDLLRREGGASIVELMTATGWQQHSVRGALSTLNKLQGGAIQSAKRDGERRYQVAGVG
jgi:hypothetical protein